MGHVTAGQRFDGAAPWSARRRWLVGLVVGLWSVVAVAALVAGPYEHQKAQRLTLAVLAVGVVVVVRRWPFVVLAIAVAAACLESISGVASVPLGALLGFATYAAASQLPRRASIAGTGVALVALGAGLVAAGITVKAAPVAVDAVEGFVPLLAGWFVGDSVAARRRYLAGLAEQAAREQEAEAERARQEVRQERVRIARELHDVVAHTLAVMTVQAGVGSRLMDKRPEEARHALRSIEQIGRTAQEELRVVLGLLRDDAPPTASLAPAPRLVDVEELVDTVRASGTPVTLQIARSEPALSPALELSVYRVVQEALTNVVKHAPGAAAVVDVVVSTSEVRVEITDDGGPPGDAGAGARRPAGAGHGIVGMRERVTAFGGRLEAGLRPGGGFGVAAVLPLESAP
ncbi:MAG: sensor histidine kinase [Acidimicrobiales bacterium]